MFWRGREKEVKEHNGGLPCGQVRVLVVGDSGEFHSNAVGSSELCVSNLQNLRGGNNGLNCSSAMF